MTEQHNTLAGRVAVVTGATGGIGAATARRLAAGGASVALIGRREERLKELAAEMGEIGGKAVAVAADVSDLEAMTRAAETVRTALGPVDLVVANAGTMLGAPYESAQPVEWDRMIGTNLSGLIYTGRVFVDDLLATAAEGRSADLVHVGSIASHTFYPTYAVYAATKAAVATLTRSLRVELGPRNVRVKNVEPGMTATELGGDMLDDGAREQFAEVRKTVQALEPGDIADAIAYACAAPTRLNLAHLIALPSWQG
ncbi:SDR family oxidoreductase [Streptomyces sp. NPDC006385]|uniref:SDR family oxidoreductase n=1 Tax=Streptomyces sp. NPDC006385 TaxID=3156761 RepID=UPI0033A00801